MIPKIIHYCWFGNGEMPKLERRCMESWKQYFPDYKIMRWDETTFDISSSAFTQAAYAAKKYAFVADYVRLYALTKFGGLYLDTDIQIVRSFDNLMTHNAFGGFETPSVLQTGVLACEAENPIFVEFFDYYRNNVYELYGDNPTLPNSAIFANLMLRHGLLLNNTLQEVEKVAFYPQDYFCPINQATRQIVLSENTYCIHYLSGSWFNKSTRWRNKTKRIIGKYLGFGVIQFLRKILGK